MRLWLKNFAAGLPFFGPLLLAISVSIIGLGMLIKQARQIEADEQAAAASKDAQIIYLMDRVRQLESQK